MSVFFPIFDNPIGFEQITVDATTGGKAFTASKYSNVQLGGAGQAAVDARVAIVTLEGTAGTNDIRWTVDGTAPTSTVGHLYAAGGAIPLVICGFGSITKFRAIRVGGTSGTITVTFLG